MRSHQSMTDTSGGGFFDLWAPLLSASPRGHSGCAHSLSSGDFSGPWLLVWWTTNRNWCCSAVSRFGALKKMNSWSSGYSVDRVKDLHAVIGGKHVGRLNADHEARNVQPQVSANLNTATIHGTGKPAGPGPGTDSGPRYLAGCCANPSRRHIRSLRLWVASETHARTVGVPQIFWNLFSRRSATKIRVITLFPTRYGFCRQPQFRLFRTHLFLCSL